MLYRIVMVTESHETIERDCLEDAQEYAREMEREVNDHSHHGVKTMVKVVYVPYSK